MSFDDLRTALADVVAIPVTPYNADGIDFGSFSALLRRLVDNGVRTVTPNGNTSEFYALTTAERHSLIRASVAAVGAEAHLLVGVGHDVDTAVGDAQLASSLGVRMIMVHQPVHPHVSPRGWLEYHAQIAEAVPQLALVLYVRAEWIGADLLVALADRCPNVIGIKYAIADASVFGRIRAEAGAERFVWIAGLAEPYALSYAVHGADGFTSGLVNVNPKLSLDLRDALRSQHYDVAESLLRRISRFEELRADNRSANNVSVVKEALFQLGLCERSIRPPSFEVSEAVRTEVAEILGEWAAADEPQGVLL